MVEENTRRGVSEKEIRDNIGKISESAKQAAKERVKLRYLLQRIAREERIDVTDAEVTAMLNQYAARSGAQSVKDWLQRAKLKEVEVRKNLRADLLTTKTIDALMGHAKLTGAGAAPSSLGSGNSARRRPASASVALCAAPPGSSSSTARLASRRSSSSAGSSTPCGTSTSRRSTP